MRMTKIVMLTLAIAAVLYILLPSLSWARNGTALSKAKHPAAHSIRVLLSLGKGAGDRLQPGNEGDAPVGAPCQVAQVKKP